MPKLFVAISLPAEVRTSLAALAPAGLPGFRPVRKDLFHLTLHFIGESEEVPVISALETVSFPSAFDLTIRGTGKFGPSRGTTILWTGIDPCEPLLRLRHEIGVALDAAGQSFDSRPWNPHITLGRARPPRSPVPGPSLPTGIDAFLDSHADFEMNPFSVDSFGLFVSETIDRQLNYREIARFPRA